MLTVAISQINSFSSIPGQVHKIFQQLQSDALAFFGMELGGKDVVAPDGGGKGIAIIGLGGDDAFVHRLWVEAVDEIDVATALDIAEQRAIRPGDFDLIPADLWDLQSVFFREADDIAFENAHASGAGIELRTFLKQCLVADADAEEGFPALDMLLRGAEQFLFAHGVDTIVERADAGEDHAADIADLGG